MKKIAICAGLILANTFAAQELSNLMRGGQNDDELSPNVNPPSPESYYRTQYGNLQFNEFRGNPNVDIPIHTLTSGKLKHPVSLLYTKAGVKVNDTPNTVGMNWILEAGGVINRTIFDKADETVSNRILLSLDDLSYLYSQQGELALVTYARELTSNFDHQPDIFNFSFPGYNGSFYLDRNFQPVLLTQDNNLKIETVGIFKQTYSFIITTNDGTKYTFGGTGATEKTRVRANLFLNGVTSFYLTKIEDTAGNKIEFTYTQVSPNVTLLGLNERQSLDKRLFDMGPAAEGQLIAPSLTPYSQSIKKIDINDPKILTQITAGNEKVTINYATAPSETFQKIGNIVIASHNVNIKKIAFEYINNSAIDRQKKRFFLERVKEFTLKNGQENFVQEYRLEYDNPLNLPDRLSFSMDYLGYSNGKSNLQTMLPNLNLFGSQYSVFNQVSGYYADRTPDFNFTKNGTLTSITYPTKGKTVFEYEPTYARKTNPVQGEKQIVIGNAEAMWADNSLIDYGLVSSRLPLSAESAGSLQSSEVEGSDVQIELKLHSNETGTYADKGRAQFEIIDGVTGQVILTKIIFLSKTAQYIGSSNDFSLEPNKTYLFKYGIVNNICRQCSGTVVVKYPKRNEWALVENGNIRLRKQYDMSENGPVNYKRIYYTDFQSINNTNSLSFQYIPEFRSNRFDQKPYVPYYDPISGLPPAGISHVGSISETILNSELQISMVQRSISSMSGTNGELTEYLDNIYDPVYPVVNISYGGDEFEKGGEEKRFTTSNIHNSYSFRPPTDDGMFSSWGSALSEVSVSAQNTLFWNIPLGNLSGKLISSKVFGNKNGQLYLKTATQNDYRSDQVGLISSVAGMTLFPLVFIPTGSNSNTYINNMYITGYMLPSYSVYLDKSVSKEYLEDVPLSTQDDASYKKITTITNYLYNNPDKQLSRATTVFADSVIRETAYAYAGDKGNQKLVNANIIGIPLETEVKENSKTISKSEIKYENTTDLFPSSAVSYDLQSSAPSTQVTYDLYDSKGNLQQYTAKNGISTAIIWGYNQTQPIAKIEGAKLSDIPQTLIDSIVNTSITDAQTGTDTSEQALIDELDLFRNNTRLSGYQISTYSYDPLVGVKSITPPQGIREVYIYDTANRLKEVRENNQTGKILKEYKYNYKN
ncbi:hypothetical protein [Chryseobacterium vrystaatense]|uniref:YD repeat-containing protein n=1 Tax=Chryseobacterium vrystaatense TaxID=307480 RepID=A0ABR4UNQ2_9FLAO|nr:hypothetical protein [Chryseobacterium vrystaatense]KFF26622.1 hypothetical protein IW16_12330 [Chryseobacterium vrystaatense]